MSDKPSKDVVRTLVENRERFSRFLRVRLGSQAVAEEILQQSLLKAIEAEPDLRDKERLVPWFYRILRNALIDYYRSHAKDVKRDKVLLEELETTGITKTPAADELKSAICECMGGLLPTINPGYAELLRKVDLEERAPEEVAQELGITTNNLWVKLHRARQALRKSLVQSCGACSKHACLDCTCRPPAGSTVR
ncbi:MAG: RNA polymerase sigma factor [Bdellovibrionota bacterium]